MTVLTDQSRGKTARKRGRWCRSKEERRREKEEGLDLSIILNMGPFAFLGLSRDQNWDWNFEDSSARSRFLVTDIASPFFIARFWNSLLLFHCKSNFCDLDVLWENFSIEPFQNIILRRNRKRILNTIMIKDDSFYSYFLIYFYLIANCYSLLVVTLYKSITLYNLSTCFSNVISFLLFYILFSSIIFIYFYL